MKSSSVAVNMTEGNTKSILIKFAFPVFLSQLFQQLYNVIDSLIVGNFKGKEALAAVSSSGSLIFLFISFFMGASMGAGVAISKYYGAGDHEKVNKAIHTNITVGLIAGVFLTVFGVLFTPTVLRWIDTPEEVLPLSIVYFRNYFLGAIPIVLYNTCKGIMNALGDSKRPLYYLIFSSILNVILDLLFVGVWDYGVGAAALATTISQAASVVLCLMHLMKKTNPFRFCISKMRIHIDMFKDMMQYGLPTGVQNSVIGLANVLILSNINTFGEDAAAGCGAYFKVEGFAFLPITCFSLALTTFISQNLGAHKYDRAKHAAKFGIIASLSISELIGALMFLLAPVLIGAFSDDAEVIRIGTLQCRTESLFYFLLSFSHCVAGICRGAGKAVVPMTIMLAVWCVFRIIYITVAMKISHTLVLLFLAYPITWSISSIIYLIYYKKSDWIHGFDKAMLKSKAK